MKKKISFFCADFFHPGINCDGDTGNLSHRPLNRIPLKKPSFVQIATYDFPSHTEAINFFVKMPRPVTLSYSKQER